MCRIQPMYAFVAEFSHVDFAQKNTIVLASVFSSKFGTHIFRFVKSKLDTTIYQLEFSESSYLFDEFVVIK